jgi:hypothetical protein
MIVEGTYDGRFPEGLHVPAIVSNQGFPYLYAGIIFRPAN